jgi:uncharacterized protein (TIGR02246 family)
VRRFTRTPAELAHGWRDALVGRDPDAFAGLFADEAVFVDVEHRTEDLAAVRPICGRGEIRAMCERWLAEVPSFRYDVTRVVSDGPTAAVRWRYAVDGLDLDGVTWLETAAGEITRADVLFDSLALYRGLGRV